MVKIKRIPMKTLEDGQRKKDYKKVREGGIGCWKRRSLGAFEVEGESSKKLRRGKQILSQSGNLRLAI